MRDQELAKHLANRDVVLLQLIHKWREFLAEHKLALSPQHDTHLRVVGMVAAEVCQVPQGALGSEWSHFVSMLAMLRGVLRSMERPRHKFKTAGPLGVSATAGMHLHSDDTNDGASTGSFM